MSSAWGALEVPDPWQQEAVRALRAGDDVIVSAPTGAGKTRIFEWWVENGGVRAGQAVYTVPTRALANDKFLEWRARNWKVGLATGDRTTHPDAPVLVATLETQRERFLRGEPPRVLVVDEYQLLTHPERGLHYEITLALAPPETQLLLLSGSVANPEEVADWLRRLGRRVTLVVTRERPVPLEELPVHNLPAGGSSKRAAGFWERVARGALLAGLTPLLIFAPRRAEAERIARGLAAALSPDPGFQPEPHWRDWLGPAGWSALQRRVAVHHSGQTYPLRAGLLEPLAKYGHLDFIVATTGLAAGVNFSVRGVLVSDTRVVEGARERELRPDELLQMFGRAGRRGLDEVGTILTTERGPGLLDAAPLAVSGRAEIEWPVLLRVMEDAADPVEHARQVLARLFRRTPPTLGWPEEEGNGGNSPAAEVSSVGQTPGPLRREIQGHDGCWMPEAEFTSGQAPLEACLARGRDGRWRPALRVPREDFFPGPGRLCRLPRGERNFHYGREEPVARAVEENSPDRAELLPGVAKRLGLPRGERCDVETVRSVIAGLLAGGGRELEDVVWRGPTLTLRWKYDRHEVPAWRDAAGRWLLDPPRRVVEVRPEVEIHDGRGSWVPRRGTTLRAWRELGLIDETGRVTERGRITACFHGGEGLLLAAALEDETYPVGELLRHLANVRGGFRFAGLPPGGSERLAAAARKCYGFRSFPGYLREGLPPGHGENTAEALAWAEEQGWDALQKFCPDAGRGDLERAHLEWLSLLRHLAGIESLSGKRWDALRQAARDFLRTIPAPPELPELGGRWRQRALRSGRR